MKFAFSLKSLKRKAPSSVHFAEGSIPEYTNPIHEWAIGLAIALVLFIAGVVFIGLDFYKQFGAPLKPTEFEQQLSEYQDKEVRATADVYKEKERVFNELRSIKSETVEVSNLPQKDDTDTTSGTSEKPVEETAQGNATSTEGLVSQ